MTSPTKVDVDRFLKRLIEEERTKARPADDSRGGNVTLEDIAKRVGVSKTQIINVKDEDRGAGPETVRGFVRAFFGDSYDAFHAAVADFAREHPAPASNRGGDTPIDPDFPAKSQVMASPEYAAACRQFPKLGAIFQSLRGNGPDGSIDKSVYAWSVDLFKLVELARHFGDAIDTRDGVPIKSTR